MTTGTLSIQDKMLAQALSNAKQALQAAKLKPYVEERDVREILQDIACDALQPLPMSIEAYLPKATYRISGADQINEIIGVIDRLGRGLLQQ